MECIGTAARGKAYLLLILLIGLALTSLGAGTAQVAASPAQRMIDVTASQPIQERSPGLFVAADSVGVDYTLDAPGDAIIRVYGGNPIGKGPRWYAHEATQVAEFKVPGRGTGQQHFNFRLADIKAPAVSVPEIPLRPNGKPAESMKPGELPGLYIIEVSAADAQGYAAINLRSASEVVPASQVLPSSEILGSVRNSKGQIIAADRSAWQGIELSPVLELERTFPQAAQGHSNRPVETFDAAVDSHDNVYMMAGSGIYKFGPDGRSAAWTADEDYLKYPYPSNTRNLLGVRVDPKESKRYTFGPGGGGAGSKRYGPEDATKPGFANNFGGGAIDASDNIYLLVVRPKAQIQVFAPSGKYLRSIALPENKREYSTCRFGKDGTLWVAAADRVLGLNSASGDVLKTLSVGAQSLHIGPDGTIYVPSSTRLWRFDSSGQPVPFAGDAPYVVLKGSALDLSAQAAKVPEGTSGYVKSIGAVIGEVDGSFRVLSHDPRRGGGPRDPVYALHFDRDGRFQIDSPAVSVLVQETGNIFIGGEPAKVGVQVTNLRAQPQTLMLRAQVKDLDGHAISSYEQSRTIGALSSAAAPLPLGDTSKAFGYYSIDVEAVIGPTIVASERVYGGRVVERGDVFAPYSTFGTVRAEENPELVRRAGGALLRSGRHAYWNNVEPQPGQWHFMPRQQVAVYPEHGQPMMVGLGYGEPWDKGGQPRCRITQYDTFWNYAATVIDHYKGTTAIWQFWNEPNYFWHTPKPYTYEQYAIVLQGTYSIAKAIDPETPVICDGFAGSAAMMGELAKQGAAGFTDAVPIHYPGAETRAFDDMPVKGAVENKAGMVQELAKIRDEQFPGRPLMNTEEGLWGLQDRTPRDGANLLARVYISQIAAGMDRLTWFECFSKDDPCYLLRGVQEGPWPAYFAYATASRFLENAQYVGPISDGLAQVQLFAVKGGPVAVAWSMEGQRDCTLHVAVDQVSVCDWQGNEKAVAATGGQVTLKLEPAPQFISGGGEAMFEPVVAARLNRESKAAEGVGAMATGSYVDLGLLLHTARLAEVMALVDLKGKPADPQEATKAVEAAYQAIRSKEGDGGYLRESRTALAIVRRSAYFMSLAESSRPIYAQRLAGYVGKMAEQVARRCQEEAVWYPGLMVRVAMDTSAIRQKTPATQPLDEQFEPQISKKPGQSVELEVTVYNWTKGKLEGERQAGGAVGVEQRAGVVRLQRGADEAGAVHHEREDPGDNSLRPLHIGRHQFLSRRVAARVARRPGTSCSGLTRSVCAA